MKSCPETTEGKEKWGVRALGAHGERGSASL